MSMKRTLIASLAAFGVVLLLAAGGCPQVQPPPSNGNANDNANDNAPPPTTGNSGIGGKFVGSSRCGLCHVSTHRDWNDTLHARAYQTLVNIGQQNNSVCIGCHVVGFGEPGGFVDLATTADLAGVGCESCHGGARAHAENVVDRTLRPPADISADVCGRCHTGTHHPTFEDWAGSGHGSMYEGVRDGIIAGQAGRLNTCGVCHSGDAFYRIVLKNNTVPDDAYLGVAPESLNTITCAVCHNPHAKTGNAAAPEDGRDYQLRYPQLATPTPVNTVDGVQKVTRFNLCGQCHHDRGTTWLVNSRGPHHSVQMNVYLGEMPVPVDENEIPQLLVPSRVSVHSFASEQCSTCHMYRKDFQSDIAPAISGHSFAVDFDSCATSGCHPSRGQSEQVWATLQAEIAARLANVKAALGDPATWQYTASGGPNAAGQAALPENIRKARYLISYVESDGSLGMHNPAYVRDILIEAQRLANLP